MMTDFPTKQETQYKIAILNLLIAIDEDIVDWRNFPKLYQAVRCADVALDVWAGMNLKKMKEEEEAYLRGIEDYEEEPYDT
jgi:hypothetical protein